jgi:alkylresorcinol/alkylpyrone synthase
MAKSRYHQEVPVIASVHGVLGEHTYSQAEITRSFNEIATPSETQRAVIERIHQATEVRFRHLALSAENYSELSGFTATNDAFIETALKLGAEAIRVALSKAGIAASEVDYVMATSITGLAVPSLETRLVPIIGFRPNIKRVPIFGLGCAAGAAGIARIADYLLGNPDGVALLLSVELCSLTVQYDDLSMANIVSSGLFGDGAGALVMVGAHRAAKMGITGPRVVASASHVYPGSEDAMGWNIGSKGFGIVLSPSVGDLISKTLANEVDSFLGEHGLLSSQITRWVCHSGGPRILEAVEESLHLKKGELALSWNSLAEKGNLSSAAVLHILNDLLEGRGVEEPVSGTPGLLMAMGPGFSTELVLLEW